MFQEGLSHQADLLLFVITFPNNCIWYALMNIKTLDQKFGTASLTSEANSKADINPEKKKLA